MKKVLTLLIIGMFVVSMVPMLSPVRAHSGTFPRIENWRPGDAHLHTYPYSSSDVPRPEVGIGDLAQDAKDTGLDWIIITDHSYDVNDEEWQSARDDCAKAQEDTGITVMCGRELSVDEFEGDYILEGGTKEHSDTGHYLVYGVSEYIPNTGWLPAAFYPDDPDAQDAINTVNGYGGVGFIAHPFEWVWDWNNWDVTDYTGLEIWNGGWNGLPPGDEEDAALDRWDILNMDGLASGRHVVGIGNSDAHPLQIIAEYEHSAFTYLDLPSTTEDAIIEAYKGGHAIVSNGPLLTFKIGQKKIGETANVNKGSQATLNIEWAIPDFAAMQTIRIWKYTTSVGYPHDISISGATGIESWTDPNPINVPCYYRLEGFSADGTYRVYTNPIWIQPIDRSWGKSNNVAVVDDYYGSAVGYLYPSNYPNQIFSTLSASQVSAEALANYDTVILFMFNPSGLTAARKAAINDWVHKGGKLVIWDSDQVPQGSPWDYTWLPYPFTTSVPGQTGQTGEGLNILEENQLSSSDPSSPYYIDTAALNSQTDAVGDANVLISYSPGWRIDMMATNVLGETGPAHVYASYGLGLVIYSAFDWDYAGYNYAGGAWLKKLLEQELECSYLPFGAPTVPEEVGLDVQITANAPDGYYAGKPVQFEVCVKNPTDLTGINLVARNVGLTVIFAPEEIEIAEPSGGTSTVDIAPGESKTTTFSGEIKKIANNIEVKVNAIGQTDLGPIGGSGSCCLNAHSLQTPDWSFALITDLHIGYNYQAGDLDSDGKNEIDYDGRGWDDSEPLPQESNYWLTDRLASAVDTMISERNYYNVKFVVVLGDISDTAEKSEFFKAREILNRLNDYDICYIPIIGNHDVWPYTQEQAPDDRGQPHDTRATYAEGDEFFKDVFWGDSNGKNVGLITSLFGDSWKSEHSTPVSLPGCDYSSYLQNYGFSYGLEGAKIDFLGLDIAPRYHQPMLKFWQTLEPDPYPGAVTGGLAKIHQQTLDFENDYISNHQQGNTAVVLTHYPLYPIAGGCIFPNNPDKILDPLAKKYGSIYDFGGHVHRNSEEAGLVTEYKADGVGVHVRETEAMARETDVLLRTLSGRFIRIVQVKDGILDCSTRLEPLKKVDITWPFPNFAYSYASYPEPNKQITFTAYYTTFHGFRASFNWNFDDGSYGSGSSTTHTYSQDGTYNVILTVATKNLLTDEVRTMTITRLVYVHAKHVISSIPAGLSAISLLTGEDLATVPNNEYQLVLITRNVEGQDIPIVSLAIHFEEVIGDVDLSTLITEVEIGQAKSVLYMPSWPKDVEQYKLLFIPSTGAGTVYICSSATSLEEVTLENANVILNVGETTDGLTVTTTFLNGREYYLVSGVIGTGGGEVKDTIPPTTLPIIGEPKYVAETTYVSPDTSFSLQATDTGSGVSTTAYQICSRTYNSGWLIYTGPLNLSSLTCGNCTIVFNSTDNVGNVENMNYINVTLVGPDINGDDRVDIFDALMAGNAFGSYPGHPSWNPIVDVNFDGQVDIYDLILVARMFGKHYL